MRAWLFKLFCGTLIIRRVENAHREVAGMLHGVFPESLAEKPAPTTGYADDRLPQGLGSVERRTAAKALLLVGASGFLLRGTGRYCVAVAVGTIKSRPTVRVRALQS